MGLVIYLFAAVACVLFVGWALYVLPTPGPLGPGFLAVAMLPALIIMGLVFAGVVTFWCVAHLLRMAFRFVSDLRRH